VAYDASVRRFPSLSLERFFERKLRLRTPTLGEVAMRRPVVLFVPDSSLVARAAWLAALLLVSFCAVVRAPVARAQSSQANDESGYRVVVPGLLAGPAASFRFETTGLQVTAQDLVMGRGEARAVKFPLRAVMELRGGGVTTTLRGEARKRVPGDFWELAAGETIDLSNRGDVAVIRLLLLDEGR
jgi:hypothetical protein